MACHVRRSPKTIFRSPKTILRAADMPPHVPTFEVSAARHTPFMVSLRALFDALDARFPFSRAESWDKTGLMVGDFSSLVQRVLVTYEVTDAALDAAKQHGCEAVVAYHPLIFKPLESLDFSDRTAHLCARLIRENRSLLCVHTALDGATPPNALGDALARQLGIAGAQVGKPSGYEKLASLTYFVAPQHLEVTRQAAWEAGAGAIGNYDQCSATSAALGTFRPLQGATPAVGEIGVRHEGDEVRVELLAPEHRAQAILAAIRAAQKYEEVAYFLSPLLNREKNQSYGPLRFAANVEKLSLDQWIERARLALNPPSVRVARPDNIEEFPLIACSPGSGASFIASLPRGTIFISGDFKHHDALLAQHRGVALVDVSHAATESAAVELIAGALESVGGIEIVRDAHRNPFGVLVV